MMMSPVNTETDRIPKSGCSSAEKYSANSVEATDGKILKFHFYFLFFCTNQFSKVEAMSLTPVFAKTMQSEGLFALRRMHQEAGLQHLHLHLHRDNLTII